MARAASGGLTHHFTAENAENAEENTEETMRRIDELTEKIIGAAIAVHKQLGPGLLESAYEACLAYEMAQLGLSVQRQKELPVVYRGVSVECGYRIDLLVEGEVVLEIKAVEKLEPIHEA